MKIYSRRMLLLCTIFLINNIVFGAPSPMITYLQNKFNAAEKYVKDYQQCLFGKKSCTPREQQIKTATLMVGALVLLSTLLYVVQRVPKVIPIQQQMMNIESKIASFKQEIKNLQDPYKNYMKQVSIVEFESPIQKFPNLSNNINDLEQRVIALKKMSAVDIKAYSNAAKNIKRDLQEIENVIAMVRGTVASSVP